MSALQKRCAFICATEFFHSRGFTLDDARYRELSERDTERENSYGETVVEVEDLSHVYPNGGAAVSGVTLSIRQGEFVAILSEVVEPFSSLPFELSVL